MKVVDITTENVDEFSDILTEDVKESIGRKFIRGKGLKNEDQEPCGCLVWEYKNMNYDDDTEAEILKLSLKDHAGRKELFDAFDLDVKEESTAKCYFDLPGAEKQLTEDFSERGFDTREQESRDAILMLEEMSEIKLLRRKPSSYVVGLEMLLPREFRQGIMKCLYYDRRGLVEDLSTLPMTWYDQEISCAVRTDGEVTGFLLIHAFPSGVLMPVLLFAVGPDHKTDVLDMMRFAFQAAFRKYPPDTKILVRRHNAATKGLVQKMFPTKKGETALCGERKK